MTSRELTAVGLALLGITVGLRSLTILTGPFTVMSSMPFRADQLANMLAVLVAACVAAVVFSVIPAVIILRNRDRWAARLFPASSPGSPLQPSVLYATGLLLLGIYFIVSGAATAVLGVAMILDPPGISSSSAFGQRAWVSFSKGRL